MTGIYKITSPTGRIYIGSSINLEHRKNEYKRMHCKGQCKLLNSLKKYGFESHKFDILEECSIEELYDKEAYYGHLYKCLSKENLNCKLPKKGDIKYSISDSTRELMRKAQLGKKASTETRDKMSKSQTGRIHSDETKAKMANSNKNLKYVICTQTGIFYEGTAEAAKAYNMNRHTLKNKLNGSKKNNTSLKYI